jgi:hypothetical protein
MAARILIVDDEAPIVDMLSYNLIVFALSQTCHLSWL